MYYLKLFLRFLLSLARFAITAVAVVVAGYFLVLLWRTYMLAPWTRDGRVLAQVVDVAPEVSGTIAEVLVQDNQFVHKGDELFALDPVRFHLAITQAQAQLDATKAQLDAAKARLDAAKAQLALSQSDVNRRKGLTGIVSASDQDRFANTAFVARATREGEQATLGGTQATLEGAQAALDVATLNLKRSVLYAPATGYVTHLRLRVGDYANAGQPRVAVVDSESFWVTGYFEETKLRQVHVGDPARIKLMAYDQPVLGHVESIGRGISDPNDQINSRGLPTVNPIFTWVRLAQRVPVRIAIDSVPQGIELVAGLTASVSLGAESKPPVGSRGKLVSWLEDNL